MFSFGVFLSFFLGLLKCFLFRFQLIFLQNSNQTEKKPHRKISIRPNVKPTSKSHGRIAQKLMPMTMLWPTHDKFLYFLQHDIWADSLQFHDPSCTVILLLQKQISFSFFLNTSAGRPSFKNLYDIFVSVFQTR